MVIKTEISMKLEVGVTKRTFHASEIHCGYNTAGLRVTEKWY